MAQPAVIEPGTPLHDLALVIDLNKVPEKLRCKSCEKFLINGFKTACCDGSICEKCNLEADGGQCPLCRHTPFLSSPSKAARGTARSYLKTNLANAEPIKTTEPFMTVHPVETVNYKSEADTIAGVKSSSESQPASATQTSENVLDTTEIGQDSGDVVQSIEPREKSRRPTLDSTSGNEPDDDIEINVGTEYDVNNRPQIEAAKRSPIDEDQRYYEKPRKNSTMQPKQESYVDDSYNYNNMPNFDSMPMPTEAQANQFAQYLAGSGMNAQQMNMPSSPNDMMQMQIMMQQHVQQMQQMGMQIPPLMMPPMMPMNNMMGPNANWQNNMAFPNMMNNQFMNNSGSFSQYPNLPNGDSRLYSKHGNFQARGRGRKGGRGGRGGNFYQQQYQQDQWRGNGNANYNFNGNMMPSQSQYEQTNMHFSQNHFSNRAPEEPTNIEKDYDQDADDDEFAPGGQDDIREALGDSYEKKSTPPPRMPEIEEPILEEIKQEEIIEPPIVVEKDPSPENTEPTPKPEVKEDIPEAYREDLDTVTAPLSAPLGPSAKDVPFRSRGHGRFPSRGRGSFHGMNGYPPHSPARTLSQSYTQSPPSNQGPGVVGAPTGPRAMREKEMPVAKPVARSESDGGFKIRGQASVVRPREEPKRSATPRSTYNDEDDRDNRDSSRRYSKYDRKNESSSRYYDQVDEYDADRDRKRRKSHRDDEHYHDHDMQDADQTYSHSRSDTPDYDRGTSRRNGRREKERDKPKDKYSSSTTKHKSSSRKYDYEDSHDGYDSAQVQEESNSRSTRPSKKSTKYEDRDDRKDRDHERAERDKHRKRSRHDREREEGYEDDDEEEARRRSRKHKKEHTSSSGRKDRERERDRDKERDRDREYEEADLGMRISGRSGSHRTSGVVTPSEPATDKDPHTLEREARNRERMLKEQQRRENAAKAGGGALSGGRTRSFKYEDDIERSLAKPSRRR